VLADGEFYRVGGHAPVRGNVRIIAATHQALEERVRQGLFREDLFHRLNVIRIKLPSLRERREDVPLLIKHFLKKSAQDLGVEIKQVSEDAMKALAALPYPGNVRQLENLCHWLTVMAPGQVVEAKDLPPETLHDAGNTALEWSEALARSAQMRLARGDTSILNDLTSEFERTLIRVALAQTGGRKIDAAALLGWGRNTLTRKIQELKMELPTESAESDHEG
jgi:two-component system nitrogen regulation response regulator GlnG